VLSAFSRRERPATQAPAGLNIGRARR
jgi:hypothetical protein